MTILCCSIRLLSSLLDECGRQLPSKPFSRCEPVQSEKDEASWRHDRDILADLADYEWLTGAEAAILLEDLASSEEPVHRQLSRLRKSLTADRAALVVQQTELRRRGVAKFGELATKLFFTDIALQQSTDLWTARYKASRLASGANFADYCCGIGGDLLALAERGTSTGWDCAAEIVKLANANLQAIGSAASSRARVGLVEEQTPSASVIWHLDPDRRSDGRRSTQLQWHSPGPEIVDQWLATSPNGMLKLAPATTVPDHWAEQAELEWLSRDRQCRQQIVWFGSLATASGQRRATAISTSVGSPSSATPTEPPATFIGAAECEAELTDSIAEYLYDTDPSIRAAGLSGAIAAAHDLRALNAGVSYLTSEVAVDHPLLARFRVLDQLPLRTSPLSKHLRSLNIGQLEIKKRGVDTDPERLRKQLKLRGDKAATLILTRVETREIAILASRDEG